MEINTDDEVKKVIERIKTIRKEIGMSQLDLALEAGISQGFLATIESHKKIPTISTVIKIARALDISPSVFFEDGSTKDSSYRRMVSAKKASIQSQKKSAEKISEKTIAKILPAFLRTLKKEIETELRESDSSAD